MNASRGVLLAANWKANQHWDDCEVYAKRLRAELPEYFDADAEPEVELLVCPPLPYITVLGGALEECAVLLGAQDVSASGEGACTGEVSAGMLSDIGCDFCIVGHSERRARGEGGELLVAKLIQLRQAKVYPVVCVGESLDTREAGRAVQFTLDQLEELRAELAQLPAEGLVIAYEPVWAIGTGRNAEPADAQEMAAGIRRWLAGLSVAHGAEGLVLYGGSVNPANVEGYLNQRDIDGALIGGASLKADAFAQMARIAQAVRENL